MSLIVTVEPGCKVEIQKWQGSSLVYGIDIRKIITPGDVIATMQADLSPNTGLQTLGSIGFDGTVVMARVSQGDGSVDVDVDLLLGWHTAAGDFDQRALTLKLVSRLPSC